MNFCVRATWCTAGCADVPCRPGERKVGSTCFEIPAADASAGTGVDGRAVDRGDLRDEGSQDGADSAIDAANTSDPDPAPPRGTVAESCNEVNESARNACGGCLALPNEKGAACNAGIGACAVAGTYECVDTDTIACTAVADKPTPEVCDGLDNDCDGTNDNGLLNSCGGPCAEDVPAETCDGLDNDCDGFVDEGLLPNLIRDPSFEKQVDRVGPPWSNFKGAFITSDAHQGSRAATIVAEPGNETSVAGWNDVYQAIPVELDTTYKIEAWIRTSSFAQYGRLGARDGRDWMVELAAGFGKAFGALSEYTYQSTLFTTGATTNEAHVYIGIDSGGASTSLTVDDVAVSLLQCK